MMRLEDLHDIVSVRVMGREREKRENEKMK